MYIEIMYIKIELETRKVYYYYESQKYSKSSDDKNRKENSIF